MTPRLLKVALAAFNACTVSARAQLVQHLRATLHLERGRDRRSRARHLLDI